MDKIRRNYQDIAPSGPTYSRAVRSGNLVFIAACTARGTDAQGKLLMEQLDITLDRIVRLVEAEGGNAQDITKITTVVTSVHNWNAHREDQQTLFEISFKGVYPANTLVEITALAEPGQDVEIEAIAAID